MPRRQYTTGPACGIAGCKATKYYSLDGQTYCQNNHLAEGIHEYVVDDDDAGTSLGRRRQRGPKQQTRSKLVHYSGKDGYALYLQAFQVILRHQVKFIQKKLQLDQYEVLFKDVWQAFLNAQDASDELPEDVDESDSDMDVDLHSDEETDMPQKYVSSKYTMHRPVLMHSVALCYITLLLLRVPIRFSAIVQWIHGGEFPFFRAIAYVPGVIRARLEGVYHDALSLQLLPDAERLWKWTTQTAKFLRIRCKLEVPALNYRPILLEIVRNMMLPLDVFHASIAVVEDHGLDLRIEPQDGSPPGLPETRLLAGALLVANIFYDLSGLKKAPMAQNQLCSLRDKGLWADLVKYRLDHIRKKSTFNEVTPSTALVMPLDKVDEYLKWFNTTWVQGDPRNNKDFPHSGTLHLFRPPNAPTPEQMINLEPQLPSVDRAIEWLYSQPVSGSKSVDAVMQSGRQKGLIRQGYDGAIDNPFRDLVSYTSMLWGLDPDHVGGQLSWLEERLGQSRT